MIEFDKWWRRRGRHIKRLNISMDNPGGKSYHQMCNLAWQAALEWVKSRAMSISDDRLVDVSVIEEELE